MTRAIIAFRVFSLLSSSMTVRARRLFTERRRFLFCWITELRFGFSSSFIYSTRKNKNCLDCRSHFVACVQTPSPLSKNRRRGPSPIFAEGREGVFTQANISLLILAFSFPQQWRLPRGDLGPCSKVDLWYLFVTIFSICTIVGFGIFHLLVKSKEPETTAVFGAIYALCGVMILLRIHYFYMWFTRRSAFWRKWKTMNRVWTVVSPRAVLNANGDVSIV